MKAPSGLSPDHFLVVGEKGVKYDPFRRVDFVVIPVPEVEKPRRRLHLGLRLRAGVEGIVGVGAIDDFGQKSQRQVFSQVVLFENGIEGEEPIPIVRYRLWSTDGIE